MLQSSTSPSVSGLANSVHDVLANYDALVDALPAFSNHVKSLQRHTEATATQLYDRVNSLVDGYRHLDALSTNIPEDLRRTSADIMKSRSFHSVLEPPDKIAMQQQLAQLDDLKAEVRSLSHERVVVEVLTRNAIQSVRQKSRPSQHLVSRGSTQPSVSKNNHSSPKDLARDESIPLPLYSAPAASPTGKLPTPPGQISTGGNRQVLGAAHSSARAVRGLTVPSMRQGSLPEELRSIVSTPAVPQSKRPEDISAIKRRNERLRANKLKQQAEKDRTGAELALLRKKLDHEAKRNAKVKSATEQRLDTLSRLIASNVDELPLKIEAAVSEALKENAQMNPVTTGSRPVVVVDNNSSARYRVLTTRVGASHQPKFRASSYTQQTPARTVTIDNMADVVEDTVKRLKQPTEHVDPCIKSDAGTDPGANTVENVVSFANNCSQRLQGRPSSFQIVGDRSGVHWEQLETDTPEIRRDNSFAAAVQDMVYPESIFSCAPSNRQHDSHILTSALGYEVGELIVVQQPSQQEMPETSDENSTGGILLTRQCDALERIGDEITDEILAPIVLEYGQGMNARILSPTAEKAIVFQNRNVPFVSRVLSEPSSEACTAQNSAVEQKPANLRESITEMPLPQPSVSDADDRPVGEILSWLPMVMLGQQEAIRNNQSLILSILEQQKVQQSAPSPQQEPITSSPSAMDIAMALTTTIDALAQKRRLPEPTIQPIILQRDNDKHSEPSFDISAAVNAGVVAGVRDALSLMASVHPQPVQSKPQIETTVITQPKPSENATKVESSVRPKANTGLLHVRGVGTGHATYKRGAQLEDVVARDVLSSRNQIAFLHDDEERDDDSISIVSDSNFSGEDLAEYGLLSRRGPLSSAHRNNSMAIWCRESDSSEHWYEETRDSTRRDINNSHEQHERHICGSNNFRAKHHQHTHSRPSGKDGGARNSFLPKPLVSLVTGNAATVGVMAMRESDSFMSSGIFSVDDAANDSDLVVSEDRRQNGYQFMGHISIPGSRSARHEDEACGALSYNKSHRNRDQGIFHASDYEANFNYRSWEADSSKLYEAPENSMDTASNDWSSVGLSVDLAEYSQNSENFANDPEVPSSYRIGNDHYRAPTARFSTRRPPASANYVAALSSSESRISSDSNSTLLTSSSDSPARRGKTRERQIANTSDEYRPRGDWFSDDSFVEISRDDDSVSQLVGESESSCDESHHDDHYARNSVGSAGSESVASEDCAIPLDKPSEQSSKLRLWRPSSNNLVGQWASSVKGDTE